MCVILQVFGNDLDVKIDEISFFIKFLLFEKIMMVIKNSDVYLICKVENKLFDKDVEWVGIFMQFGVFLIFIFNGLDFKDFFKYQIDVFFVF